MYVFLMIDDQKIPYRSADPLPRRGDVVLFKEKHYNVTKVVYEFGGTSVTAVNIYTEETPV